MKNVYVVLDVETAGSLGWPLIYDIAWLLMDKKGNVLVKRSFCVEEVFTKPELMTQAYFGKKVFTMYPFMFAKQKIQIANWKDILETLRKDCEEFNANIFTAYNAAFDIRAMRLTDFWYNTGIKSKQELQKVTKRKRLEENISEDELDSWLNPPMPFPQLKVLDIYMLACERIMHGKKFRQIALENLWLTPNGNFQTNAQVCWRYLSGDYSFEEKHTGIDDIEIEAKILAHCLSQKKRINYDKLEPACIVSRISQPNNGMYFHERVGQTFTEFLNCQLTLAGISWERFHNKFRDVKWSQLLDEDICPASLTKKTVGEWKQKFEAKYNFAWDNFIRLPENFQKVIILMGLKIDWYVPDDQIDPDLDPRKLRRYFEDKKELDNRLPRLAAKESNILDLIKMPEAA